MDPGPSARRPAEGAAARGDGTAHTYRRSPRPCAPARALDAHRRHRAAVVVEVDTVGSASVFLTAPCPLTANFCSEPCTAQSRHSSLRRVLVLPGGMPLLHETSSTATHHPLPNGLPVIDLHKTKPVCACAAQRPLNASASRPGGASTREAPGFPRSLPCSPGPTVPMKYTRFVGAPLLQTLWATEI